MRVCVCVRARVRVCERERSSAIIILYAKNSKVKRSVKERRNGDGCIEGNGVSGNHSFIICTPLKMATGGILLPYAAQQIEKFWVHIWAVICRVCVMRCVNCSGCKWWSTTKLFCMHIYRMLVHAILRLVCNVKRAACSIHTAYTWGVS